MADKLNSKNYSDPGIEKWLQEAHNKEYELKPDPKVETWLKEVHQDMERVAKNPPDPQMDPAEYFALLGGYKNGAEFKKDYSKRMTKAVGIGTAGGMGLFAAAFATSTGVIFGGAEIPSIAGTLARFGLKAVKLAKNVGIQGWNVAKSVWTSLMVSASTSQGQEVLKNSEECVSGMVDGTALPNTTSGLTCGGASKIYKAVQDVTQTISEKILDKTHKESSR
jgi:hypothetical protein